MCVVIDKFPVVSNFTEKSSELTFCCRNRPVLDNFGVAGADFDAV